MQCANSRDSATYHSPAQLSFHTFFSFQMPPKRNVIIGHVDGVPPTHQSSRSVRTVRNPSTDVVIGCVKTPASGQQPSGSRPRKDKSTDLIIQAAPKQPLEADLLGEGDDLGDQPQAKVCAFMAQYLICDITIFRHLWGDGSSFVTDIFTCYWRCKESPGMLSAPCAAIRWRSNAMTAMGPTTSADCAVLMHTSGPHIIGYSAGLATILSP